MEMKDQDILSNADRWKILSIFTGTYFISALAALSFAPLLPFISEELHISSAGLGLFISLIYFGALVSGFPVGLLSDYWGVPKTITLGLLIFGLSLGLVACSPSFNMMAVFLFIAGMGYGVLNPATSKGVILWFTAKWRATAMAIKQTGFTLGTMAAAVILPSVAEVTGWRWAVAIVAVAVIFFGFIGYFMYPASVTKKKPEDEHTTPVKRKRGSSVWKNKQIVFYSIISIFLAAVQMSGTAYLSLYMVDYFSYTKVQAGLFLGLTQGFGALGRVFWGRISDLYFAEHRNNEVILVGLMSSITCIIIGLLPVNTHYMIIGIVAAFFGFAAFGFNVLFLTLIGEIAGPEKAGQAIGLWVTICYFGVVISPPIFGYGVDTIGYNKSWVLLGAIVGMVMIFTIFYTRTKSFKAGSA